MSERLSTLKTVEEKNVFVASLPLDQKDQLLGELLKLAIINRQK